MGVSFTSYWLDDENEDILMSCIATSVTKTSLSTNTSESVDNVDRSELAQTIFGQTFAKYFPRTRCYIASGCVQHSNQFVSNIWQKDANKWVTVHAQQFQQDVDLEKACPWQNNSFVLFFSSGKIHLLTVFPRAVFEDIELKYYSGVAIDRTAIVAYRDFIVFISATDLIFYHVPSKKISFLVPHQLACTQDLLHVERGDYIILLQLVRNVNCVIYILYVPLKKWIIIKTNEKISNAAQNVHILAGRNKIHVRGTLVQFSINHQFKEEEPSLVKCALYERQLKNVTLVFN